MIPGAAWALYEEGFRARGDAIIKDWVKSAKHRWREACFIPAGSSREDFERIFAAFRAARGGLFDRGVVLPRFVPLASRGRDMRGFPLVEEHRLFFLGGELVARPYCPGLPDPWVEKGERERWTMLARRFSGPFLTLDVARLETGGWTVVEAGDGQVSGLPLAIDPQIFYATLANHLARLARGDMGLPDAVDDIRPWRGPHGGRGLLPTLGVDTRDAQGSERPDGNQRRRTASWPRAVCGQRFSSA